MLRKSKQLTNKLTSFTFLSEIFNLATLNVDASFTLGYAYHFHYQELYQKKIYYKVRQKYCQGLFSLVYEVVQCYFKL